MIQIIELEQPPGVFEHVRSTAFDSWCTWHRWTASTCLLYKLFSQACKLLLHCFFASIFYRVFEVNKGCSGRSNNEIVFVQVSVNNPQRMQTLSDRLARLQVINLSISTIYLFDQESHYSTMFDQMSEKGRSYAMTIDGLIYSGFSLHRWDFEFEPGYLGNDGL